MRFLLYNIAYGTGGPRSHAHGALTVHRYLQSCRHHMKFLGRFIRKTDPDIVGLVEFDGGSFRTGGINHAAQFARTLEHHYAYSSKYGRRSMARWLPLLRHQGNALFSKQEMQACENHYLPWGFKRLVMEGLIGDIHVFLVHLALNRHTRERQLDVLGDLVGSCREPVILAGDFNTFEGVSELDELTRKTGLTNVNSEHLPTFPAWHPRRQLDFILASDDINVRGFSVLKGIRLSDHLPLMLDFDV